MGRIPEKEWMGRIVEEMQADFWRLSDDIWSDAELGLREHNSSRRLADLLEARSFQVVRGAAGMATAFVASWSSGRGKPVVGLTAEYDALPGLSQKAGVPSRRPVADGAPGHGCGHNTMAAMQALAAAALQETARQGGLDIAIRYFGCPAEELLVSRPFMVREGLFQDVDVVIDCHADSMFKTTYGPLGTALCSLLVEFAGRASHAAWKPWMGRSAADAVELMHAGTERMREHLPQTSRIHWATRSSGEVPNVVPDRASTWYLIRDLDENLEAMVSWVRECAEGAALMTQTRHAIRVLSAAHQRFYNRMLAEIIFRNIQAIGKPAYTDREEAFARELQKNEGYPVKGMEYPLALVDAEKDEFRGSSSDVGDVCLVVPTGLVSMPVWVPGSPAHHWTVTSAAATSIAHKGITAGAKAVVFTVSDLLADVKHIRRIKEEFAELTRRRPYRPFLPDEAEVPIDFHVGKSAPLA